MPQPDRRIWIDGRLVPWGDATVHVLSHSLQRGSLVFDYTSVHDTPRGMAIFRLDDHLERFLRSVSIVGLPLGFGLDELRAASLEAARANPGANAFKICAYLPSVEVDVVPMDEHVSVAIAVYHGAKDIVLRKANPRPMTPTLSVKRLAELGFRRVSLARMLPAAALMGMKKALEIMRESVETGKVHDRPDLLVGIEEITELMGYALINQLESEFSLEDDLQTRYKGEGVDYVRRGH